MPVSDNFQLQIAVNGGTPRTSPEAIAIADGGIVADVGDTLTLSARSLSGIAGLRYEIYDYPNTYACPAGWSTASDGTTYFVATTGAAAPNLELVLRGKYMTRLLGRVGSSTQYTLVDEDTSFQVKLANGVEDFGLFEQRQFHTAGWIVPLKALARLVAAGGGGGGGSLTPPDDPGDSGKIAVALSGDLSWLAGGATDDVVSWDGSKWVATPRAGLSITSFALTTPLVEAGSTVATPSFTASYNATPTAATLTDSVGTSPKDVHATPTSFSSSGSFPLSTPGSSVVFTLTATKGSSTTSRTATLTAGQKNYCGVGVAGGNTESFIEALATGTLATSRAGSFALSAGSAQYLYFSCRATYGTPVFKDHATGFAVAMTLVSSTISVTNAHGFTENYQLWVSDNPNLGSITVDVT